MAKIVFSDEIVNATELRRNQKLWLGKAHKEPVTVKYGRNTLTIINRDTVRKLYSQKHYTELVLKFYRELASGAKIDTFPWVQYLDEDERKEFHDELLSCVTDALVTDNWLAVEELLEDWKATAEAESKPEVARLLRARGTPGEYTTLEE